MNFFARPSFLLLCAACVLATSGFSATPEPDRPIEIIPRRMDYPREAENRGMDGYATVVIEVDETGKLVDFLITEASHDYFAKGAERIVRTAFYEPARIGGRKVPLRAEVPIEFKAEGIIINSEFQAIVDLYLQGGHARDRAFKLPTLRELDGIPVPIDVAPPTFPKELAERGVTGKAVIDFFIDETGKVRMPAIASQDYPALGDLAIRAVNTWRFEPPTCRQKPVTVRVRQEFRFHEGSPVAE